MEKGRGGGIRRSTPLLRRTGSVAAAARRRELADAPGEEVAGREGRRRGVAGHCPMPPDLLTSSELSSTASLRLFGCRSSVLFCSVLASDLPISPFLFLPDTQTPSQNPNLSPSKTLIKAPSQNEDGAHSSRGANSDGECFDRKKKSEEIGSCVEYCSVPVVNAQNAVQNEVFQFQEKLQRSLMVCQDKFEAAKLQPNKGDVVKGLESYVDQSVQDCIKTLPHIVGKLKTSLRMTDLIQNYMIRQSEVESGLLGASYVAGNCSAPTPDPLRSPA
nr:protein FAM136A-like [Ipomoea batatas]